ncbi:hypothetical protein HYH03_001921 [Edaphochlamys debaryana]|uniref:protein-serine/threonine phosphatase n=1 Tax=Edaphochlamys debaryana TaxID=47281 RepID=A0A835YES1_9CHLO|nr:hypothetical protein HYH03_001921 [Edaphochlamys debaryana]|eukprot:KAG2500347.1 hypothetical protein HYH03_001921 [Edaphochlamys debaryana]
MLRSSPRFAGGAIPGQQLCPAVVPRCHLSGLHAAPACQQVAPARSFSGWASMQRHHGGRVRAASADSDVESGPCAMVVASELDVGYSSAQGARDCMEDEVQVHYNTLGHYLYAAVFDGHGGDHAAQWLAKELHVQVESCLVGRTLSNKAGIRGNTTVPIANTSTASVSGSTDSGDNGNGNGAAAAKQAAAAAAAAANGTGTGSSHGISSRDICKQQLVDSFHMADHALMQHLQRLQVGAGWWWRGAVRVCVGVSGGGLVADHALMQHLQVVGGEEMAGSGSTATVVVIKDDKLVVANVGDSQAVLCRKGNPLVLAHYHRVYGTGPDVGAEIERVLGTGGWVDDGRVCGVLAVSRAFGDWEFKGKGLPRLLQTGIERGYWDEEFASEQSFTADPVISTPDVTETLLSPDDEFLIVASDGLWDVLPPREAVQWARKEFKAKKDAAQVAASLATLALKRYSTDNVAVVVVDLQGAEARTKPKAKAASAKRGMFSFLRSTDKGSDDE